MDGIYEKENCLLWRFTMANFKSDNLKHNLKECFKKIFGYKTIGNRDLNC